ncbi:glycosyltransferase EpsH [Epilithonimonas hungarica]|uniref:glycosyltransferase family 2 protein n=1 Tax=Epilithonimonas hungarica TaxID=454006 RepID=UPI00278086D4|nr:glycosyltransferase family 2 protein [Epilithonimonas hungarica]MDP9956820.1 glycosyltransferase EpsH [Epilithonimonas hungarica]
MKVSIIIPCYNVEDYISQCLDSITRQTYQNIEIICINDGSTDGTLSIIENYAVSDSRIKLYNQNNKGLSITRTLGIEYALGDHVMFVDSDDWLELNCLEILMASQKDFDVICFSYFRDFKNVTLAKKLYLNGPVSASELQRKIVGPINEELRYIENLDSLATVWGKLYKLDKVKGVNFPEINTIGTWEDGLFNLYVLENCENILIIDQPLYHYRKDNQGSVTSVFKNNLYKKWLYKFELIDQLIKLKNDSYSMALKNRIAISILGLSLVETGSNKGVMNKMANLRIILNHPVYRGALKDFKLKNLSVKWKIFYTFAKNKSAFGVYVLSTLIRSIKKLKNK